MPERDGIQIRSPRAWPLNSADFGDGPEEDRREWFLQTDLDRGVIRSTVFGVGLNVNSSVRLRSVSQFLQMKL